MRRMVQNSELWNCMSNRIETITIEYYKSHTCIWFYCYFRYCVNFVDKFINGHLCVDDLPLLCKSAEVVIDPVTRSIDQQE